MGLWRVWSWICSFEIADGLRRREDVGREGSAMGGTQSCYLSCKEQHVSMFENEIDDLRSALYVSHLLLGKNWKTNTQLESPSPAEPPLPLPPRKSSSTRHQHCKTQIHVPHPYIHHRRLRTTINLLSIRSPF